MTKTFKELKVGEFFIIIEDEYGELLRKKTSKGYQINLYNGEKGFMSGDRKVRSVNFKSARLIKELIKALES